jgi:hypothetical protein
MEHADEFSALHLSGRLFQQYLTDMWSKTEKEALDFLRRNQSQLRADLYQGLADAVSARKGTDTDLERMGTKVILPSSHTGSPRQMHQLYQVLPPVKYIQGPA